MPLDLNLKLISRREAAAMLGVHPGTIKRYEASGKLVPIRLTDRNTRYSLSGIQKLISDSTAL